MTVSELCVRMTSREFAEWKAFARYFEPFGDEWRQAALIITAVLAPYCRKDKFPKPHEFMPIREIPQTAEEVAAEIMKLTGMMGGEQWQDSSEKPETPSPSPSPE